MEEAAGRGSLRAEVDSSGTVGTQASSQGVPAQSRQQLWLQERPFGTGQPGQAPRAVWAGEVEEVVGRVIGRAATGLGSRLRVPFGDAPVARWEGLEQRLEEGQKQVEIKNLQKVEARVKGVSPCIFPCAHKIVKIVTLFDFSGEHKSHS